MDPIWLVKQVIQLYMADNDAVGIISRHTHGLRIELHHRNQTNNKSILIL